MNFLASILLKCYLESSEPDFAMIDSFYSLHSLIRQIRLFYPLSWRDSNPLRVLKASSKLLRMHIEMELCLNLEADFDLHLLTFLLQYWPSLFVNMFDAESVMYIWDYLLSGRLRTRLFGFTLALFSNQSIMLRYLPASKLFEVIGNQHIHANIFKEALQHDKLGKFLTL